MIKKYNYDSTGISADNAVVNESHIVATSRIFIAKTGALYSKSLVVTQSGNTLTRGLDYRLVVFNAEASKRSGQEVHSGLVMETIESQDPILLTYQTVGGEYASYENAIMQQIEALGLESSMILYGDLVGVPEVFAPGPHKTFAEDLYGMSRVVEMLSRIEDALLTGQAETISELFKRMDGKVNRGGRMTLRPENGSITVPDNVGAIDLVIPRSAAQNAKVSLELTYVADGKPFKAILSYNETLDAVANVAGYYIGPTSMEFPIAVGAVAGNGNVTVLRIADGLSGVLSVEHFYVLAINTTDDTLNDKYGSIAVLETPSTATFDMVPLVVSSGAVTSTTIDAITANADTQRQRIDKLESDISLLNDAIDNAQVV